MASDDLTVEVAGSSSLAAPAKQALEECIKAFGDDVLREAGRLEASQHVGSGAPMITNSMIEEATLLGRRGHIAPRTPKLRHFLQVVSYASAVIAGVFAGKMDTAWGSIGFAVSAVVGIAAFFWGRSDG
ncbi:hypothetical protein [Streptomyces toxytricini]|uniref:hypothetical protein n=1 Tax=Streptomyces toxytricini TaxID=67369 RepID=UPI00343C4A9B